MGTQIEEAALAYAHATKAMIETRESLAKFKQDMERAAYSAPILGRRFALTGALKEALLAAAQADLADAINAQATASQRLDAAAGIKAPAL